MKKEQISAVPVGFVGVKLFRFLAPQDIPVGYSLPAPLKEREIAAEKITRKGDADASQLTDVVRGGFEVATPEHADAVVKALARRYAVLDEGWVLTADRYLDAKVMLRLDDGTVAEVQLWPPGMYDAKSGEGGGGHRMYKKALDPGVAPERAAELIAQMRALYSETLAGAGNDWSGVGMPGGGQRSAGTQARISASEMTAPLSPTSAQDTGTQGPSSRRMANALPSDGMTAGRPSQYTNSIAASPSAPIIPQVDSAFSRAASRYLEMVQTAVPQGWVR